MGKREYVNHIDARMPRMLLGAFDIDYYFDRDYYIDRDYYFIPLTYFNMCFPSILSTLTLI